MKADEKIKTLTDPLTGEVARLHAAEAALVVACGFFRYTTKGKWRRKRKGA